MLDQELPTGERGNVKSKHISIALTICAAVLTMQQALCADVTASSSVEFPSTDTAVRAYEAFFGITGGAVAVLRDRQVVYRKSFGFANIEFQVPVSSDTRFQLSSSTKLFTGTLMTMLARDGLVDYAKPIRYYLPDLPKSWSDVLLEDVMSHVSGLPEVLECNEDDEMEAALHCVYSLERPTDRRTRFTYNQTNYLLAMRVVQTVTDSSFSDVLSNRIFEPAGMSRAVLNGNSRDVVQERATGYYPNESGGITIREYRFPRFLLSAAGMNATLDDMIAFALALNDDTLLDADWKARMWRPQRLADGEISNYALGWDLREMRGGTLSAGHEGGSLTTFRVYPSSRLTVIILTNGMHKRFGLDRFADVLAQSVVPDTLTPLDSAANLAMITYMINGLDSTIRLVAERLCQFDLGKEECREMLLWLVEELEDAGRSDDAAKVIDLFDPDYDLDGTEAGVE
jgi:CubicO group peptidase (beta-lactamase class C family)